MNLLIAITGLGVLVLILEIFNLRKLIIPLAISGLLGTLIFAGTEIGKSGNYFNNMIVQDAYGTGFTILFITLTLLLVSLSHNFYRNHGTKISDFIALKLFLLAGAISMVTFGNFAMFFLGLEILSISLYVLAASDRVHIRSNEAGMKYFLLGAFASGIILFGIVLIYGATGSFDLSEIKLAVESGNAAEWLNIGAIMVAIGMFFKIAAVPFHFWAPDVYEGSPALTTATMSTLAKVTAIAAFFKLWTSISGDLPYHTTCVIVGISILSMTVGNIMALRQANVKRMLAFSGISHAGFMLMTFLNVEEASMNLFYYAAAYSLAGLAAFSVIIYVARDKGHEDIALFNGLGKTHPLMALILTFALFSMAGIPIFSGFFAKLMLFNVAFKAGYIALVIVAIINSMISIGYYFKLILAMFTKESNEERTGKPVSIYWVAIIAILLNIALGLYPGFTTLLGF